MSDKTVTSSAVHSAVVTQSGEGTTVRAFGNEILFQLTTEQTGGAMVVGLATVPPGGTVPAHIQDREEELFLIVDGQYRFWIEGKPVEVGVGGVVYLPRGVAHKFQVLGDKPGRHWVLSSPGGFDQFFSKCADIFAASGPPDFARLAAINAEYGIRLA